MALTDQEIKDLVIGVQNDLGRLRFQQIAQELISYEAFSSIVKKGKVAFEGGRGWDRQIKTKTAGSARYVGLYEADETNVVDTLGKIDVPFRHLTANYSFDAREIDMNEGEEKIVDLIDSRRVGVVIDLAELIEEAFWGAPDGPDDDLTPWGMKYWIASDSSEGFNGDYNSPFNERPGGLSHDNWNNYTFEAEKITKMDLILKMRRAYRRTGFKSPISNKDYRSGNGRKFRLYTNENVLEQVELVGESQNENLGRDVASMDGTMLFRRSPWKYVPKLDEDDDNPIYGLDWSTFEIGFLDGWYMRETDPQKNAQAHTVFTVHTDCTLNFGNVDRRRNWKGTMPNLEALDV